MRILVIDQAPRSEKSQPYDVAAIEKLLNSYASPGTKVEIGFPDDFAGSNVFLTIGAQSALNGLHHMIDRKSTRLNSSHLVISYAVFCLKKKKSLPTTTPTAHPNSSATTYGM